MATNSSTNTSDVPVVTAHGLCNQRQLDALNAAPKYFIPDQLCSAAVSTGITMAYTLHSSTLVGADGTLLPEDRVVLIVGFQQVKEVSAPIIDLLLAKYVARGTRNVRILAFDNRGIGGSSAPWWRYTTSQMAQDALALADHVSWTTAHVVGISMGGMIALELAAAAPQRVSSLSLMVTSRGKFEFDPRSKGPQRKSTFASDPVEAVTNLLELLYPLDWIRASRMEDTGESFYDTLFAYHMAKHLKSAKQGVAGLTGQGLAIRTHFVSDERLAGIRDAGFPILLVGAMRDILLLPAESIKLKERLDAPHVHTLFFENAGHGVSLQFPDEVADGLVATFQRASNLLYHFIMSESCEESYGGE